MLTAMFAKFPNLSDTEKTGSRRADDRANDAAQGGKANEPAGSGPDNISGHDIAGHGSRALDWHSLRAKLCAERDLRGSLRGENEAMASWIRAEGSFDPRAAEALCGHGHASEEEGLAIFEIRCAHDEKAITRLPDPKTSRHITGSGCGVPTGQTGPASGLNVED